MRISKQGVRKVVKSQQNFPINPPSSCESILQVNALLKEITLRPTMFSKASKIILDSSYCWLRLALICPQPNDQPPKKVESKLILTYYD